MSNRFCKRTTKVVGLYKLIRALIAGICGKYHLSYLRLQPVQKNDDGKLCLEIAYYMKLCVLVLFSIFRLIPESYRWLVARGRFEEAEMVIKRMAHTNRRPVPDLDKIRQRMKEDRDFIEYQRSLRIYTVIDLFRTRKLFKMTTLFSFIWYDYSV